MPRLFLLMPVLFFTRFALAQQTPFAAQTSSVVQTAFAPQTQCAHLIGSCAYYECVETELLPCGQQGYTLGYGHHFCKKFERVNPWPHLTPHEKELFPVDWNEWLASTAQCLHAAIDAHLAQNPATTCNTLRSAAFKSHAACYTGEPSFCFLPPRQIAHIGKIISIKGFLAAETRIQVSETAAICVEQIGARIKTETSPLNRTELATYQSFWRTVLVAR